MINWLVISVPPSVSAVSSSRKMVPSVSTAKVVGTPIRLASINFANRGPVQMPSQAGDRF